MKSLINVSRDTTVKMQLIAIVNGFIAVLVSIGCLTTEQGENIMNFMGGPEALAIFTLIAFAIQFILPSALGWRSKDKELPGDITVADVVVKPSAEIKGKDVNELEKVAKTLAVVLMAGTLTFGLSGCSLLGRCFGTQEQVPQQVPVQQPIYQAPYYRTLEK